MRARPRILLDIDGVFANFIAGSLPTIKQIIRDLRVGSLPENLDTVGHDDVRSYRMEEIFAMTADEIYAWHVRVKSPGYCAAIPPYPRARECIEELQALGDVHPVTFPWPGAPHWIIEREAWLHEKLGIDPGLAVYTSQKHLVAGDIFVEDTTKYLVRWREHHRDGVTIRVRRPYNAHEPFTQGVTVDDFAGLIKEVRSAIELREAHWRSLWQGI